MSPYMSDEYPVGAVYANIVCHFTVGPFEPFPGNDAVIQSSSILLGGDVVASNVANVTYVMNNDPTHDFTVVDPRRVEKTLTGHGSVPVNLRLRGRWFQMKIEGSELADPLSIWTYEKGTVTFLDGGQERG